MRFILTKSIEDKANKIWLSFDDIYNFIKLNFTKEYINNYKIIKLCSPFYDTIAYKWYIDPLNRIIIFSVVKNWLIYPVYIWNKNDKISKCITVDIINKYAEKRYLNIEKDLIDRKIKIRHF
jgi:hypothetical protein